MTLFGSRLKYLRMNKKLTQRELAEIINVSTSTIGMYEKNAREPSFETLINIANYFNVSVDYLLGYENQTADLQHQSEQSIAEKNFLRISLQHPQLLDYLNNATKTDINKLIQLLEILKDKK